MLDFIIVSHFHYAPALEGAVNMRAVDLKRYARQRYIVYRGHHPLRSLQRLASCKHTYNPQNLCLIISSRERAKITVPIERDCDDVDKATTIRSSGPPLWVF